MYSCKNECRLPTLRFVGGGTKTYSFNLFDGNGDPFDASGCLANFVAVSAVHKQNSPAIDIPMEHVGGTLNTVSVTIPPNLTVGLFGKYIYQISIKDENGVAEEPLQGEMYIEANVDKKFVIGV